VDPALSLAPEERLLLALGRLEPSAAERREARRAVETATFRWHRALDLACQHRVHMLLARNLDDTAVRDLVPADVREKLLQVRMAAELRNERYVYAAAEAFARLSAEGIPVLLLKGAALAATVFPAGSRALNDVDLLIRPRDYPRVARVLGEARFERCPVKGQTEREMLRGEHEVTFFKRIRNETLDLDLHWRLFSPDRSSAMSSLGYELPVERLLARATPATLGPLRALAPSAEDMFVHIATQIGIDRLQVHLGRLMDLDAIVRKGIHWGRLVESATEAGAAGITHFALSLTSALGGSVPESALRGLQGACRPCGITSRVLATPSFPFRALRTASTVVLTPLLFGRPRFRLLYCLSLALPTRGSRRMHVLRPPDSAAAYVGRLRAVLLAAGCGLLLLVQWAAGAIGRRTLAARLRARLWHAVPPPSAKEPEPSERRELAEVP